MSSGVFVIKSDGTLVEMEQTDYDSEDILQTLIAKYPNLLAGKLINESDPRKWLLISREYGVPDDEDSSNRWSIDHLFLDQDGTPTLVEVKRSSDTRIRREVVGQMLEYAANAVHYWDINKVIASFETRCIEQGTEPSELWAKELDLEEDAYEGYWEKVRTNLQVGRIRLLFVADEIPHELKQIVEFLNEQMNAVEVLALEIKQYIGQDQKTMIPRVYGQSTKIQSRKGKPREKRQWDESSFLEEIYKREGEKIGKTAGSIIEWAKSRNLRFWWGKGQFTGSCYPVFDFLGNSFWLFAILTSGKIEFQFKFMKKQPVFNDLYLIQDIIDKHNAIDGLSLPADTLEKMPKASLSVLDEEGKLKRYLDIWDQYLDTIKEMAHAF